MIKETSLEVLQIKETALGVLQVYLQLLGTLTSETTLWLLRARFGFWTWKDISLMVSATGDTSFIDQ
jgi:hypothetical protein